MLFHAGCLWRLNQLGLLGKLNRISSVSGGSITAGLLPLKWNKLSFDPARLHSDFVDEVVAPLRADAVGCTSRGGSCARIIAGGDLEARVLEPNVCASRLHIRRPGASLLVPLELLLPALALAALDDTQGARSEAQAGLARLAHPAAHQPKAAYGLARGVAGRSASPRFVRGGGWIAREPPSCQRFAGDSSRLSTVLGVVAGSP